MQPGIDSSSTKSSVCVAASTSGTAQFSRPIFLLRACIRRMEDERSWHLLLLDPQDRVTSCIWYLEHEPPTSVQSLRVRSCPLTSHESWRERINAALEGGSAARPRRVDSLCGSWRLGRARWQAVHVGRAAADSRDLRAEPDVWWRPRRQHGDGAALLRRHPAAARLVPPRNRRMGRSPVLRSEVQLRDGTAAIRHAAVEPTLQRDYRAVEGSTCPRSPWCPLAPGRRCRIAGSAGTRPWRPRPRSSSPLPSPSRRREAFSSCGRYLGREAPKGTRCLLAEPGSFSWRRRSRWRTSGVCCRSPRRSTPPASRRWWRATLDIALPSARSRCRPATSGRSPGNSSSAP